MLFLKGVFGEAVSGWHVRTVGRRSVSVRVSLLVEGQGKDRAPNAKPKQWTF